MEALALLRKATANLAARSVGLRPQQPNLLVAQQRVAHGKQTDVFHLPHDPAQWQPLQVTDSESDDFGAFYFYRAMIFRAILQRSSVADHVRPGG